MTPADLKEYADFNNDFLVWAQAEMKAVKSVDAAAAEYTVHRQVQTQRLHRCLPDTDITSYVRKHICPSVGVKANLQIIYDKMKK